MRRLTSIALVTGLVLAGVAGGFHVLAQAPAPPAPAQAPAAQPPADTAEMRANYERWRKEFKTWGRWAPIGEESKGTTS